MKLLELKLDPSTRQLRTFGAIWFPLFCAMLGLIFWRIFRAPLPWYIAGGVAGASVLLALAVPRALKPLFVGLMIVSFPIGWVVSHVLMGFVYYVVISPIGLALRIAGKDLLMRRLDREAKTYWLPLPGPPPNERYFRQF